MFAEGTASTERTPPNPLDLCFEGTALKAVVEYCYTDKISFPFDETGQASEETIARTAMSVVVTADFFALPKLCGKVIDWATAKMKQNPVLAWSLL